MRQIFRCVLLAAVALTAAACASPQLVEQQGGPYQLKHMRAQPSVRRSFTGSHLRVSGAAGDLAEWAQQNGVRGIPYGAYFPSELSLSAGHTLQPEVGLLLEENLDPKLLRDTPYSLGEFPGGTYLVVQVRGDGSLRPVFGKMREEAERHGFVPQLPVYEVLLSDGGNERLVEVRLPLLPRGD